jgi:hypothetical protein
MWGYSGAMDLTCLKTYVMSSNLRAALPQLCKKLPDKYSKPLLNTLRNKNSSGTHSQAMLNPENSIELIWRGDELESFLPAHYQGLLNVFVWRNIQYIKQNLCAQEKCPPRK